ncbi:hypothetical protein G6F68_016345 [Rhizopus microsporus]|nr:hypothetical protein G6F68_016345 [Rhizopus microsporus]
MITPHTSICGPLRDGHGGIEAVQRELAADQFVGIVGRALDGVGELACGLPEHGAIARPISLRQRNFPDQLRGARQQPRQIAHALLHVAVFRHRVQPFPIVPAEPVDQQVTVAQAREAACLGPGFRQPRRDTDILAALAQHRRADARDFRPVGFFQINDPVALVELGVIVPARFADGI